MYCNGARLNGEFMKKVIDAGIDFIRISVIGYNRQLYKKWMNIDNFDLILSNIQEIKNYIEVSNSKCLLSTYHLITDNSKIDYEINEYQNNVINLVNTQAYIWKMHNWSGNHDNINKRLPSERRSCGRPFAPELTVRAGGEKGRTGAVVPCCQTLGPPNEAKSILGHLDKESYKQILEGDRFKKLRKAHKEKNFDDIDYCKNCDFLFDDPEVLVWSNDPGAKVNHMLGTEKNFILTNYSNNN
jgi:hypothetical protein